MILLVGLALYLISPSGRPLALPPPGQAPPPSTLPDLRRDGASLRVATWNLRHFSDRPTLNLLTVARIIEDHRFDLLAIQEIRRDARQVDALLNVLGPPWRSTRISPMTGNERFTFIYRGDRLRETGRADFVPGSTEEVFARLPYMASFRAGEFDFVIISVHLSFTDVDRRQREARTLASLVGRLLDQSEEKDILLVGDFNEQRARPNMRHFEEAGWRTTTLEPTNLSSREIYDHILVHPRHTREWTGDWGVIRFDELLFGNDDRRAAEEVSDHRPVYADFAVTGPDDD